MSVHMPTSTCCIAKCITAPVSAMCQDVSPITHTADEVLLMHLALILHGCADIQLAAVHVII